MLEPKFSLKNPKSKTKTRIIIRIYYGEKRPFKYYLPVSINPLKWDNKTKLLKKEAFNKEVPKINNYLLSVSSLIRSYDIENIENNKRATKDGLKKLLDNFFTKKESKEITLTSFIDDYISTQRTKVSKGRIKRYKSFKNHFIKFCEYQKYVYDFKDINFDFYDAFIEYFFDEKRIAPNTVNGIIAILKSIMNEARKKKHHINLDYQDFVKPSNEVTRVYLNDEEILKIWNTEVNNSLQKVKEIFVFACLTGLRYSDFSDVKPHNITEKNNVYFLKVRTKKTKQPVIVPIKPLAVEILKKHDYIMPSISNQKLNEYVKELCKQSEINDEISKAVYKGSDFENKIFKKYELISSHTGRRSFCTNAFLAGVPTLSIMMMSGHTTEKSFMKYICVTKEQNADIIANHNFFKS